MTDVNDRAARRARHIWRIGAAVLVLLLFGLFLLLVKVKGNLSYVYNFFVSTRGSLAVERGFEGSAAGGAAAEGLRAVEGTEPARHLAGWDVEVNGKVVGEYKRTHGIHVEREYLEGFPNCENSEGMLTYRGNYLRDMTSYAGLSGDGTELAKSWEFETGRFLKSDGVNYWSGNGWTGQPLAVKWSNEWKRRMNLNEAARAKDGLVEIIYPGMDGKIHFLDMETGEETRAAINVGMIFKGTCSLHPEYPLLVCGSGDYAPGMFGELVCARIFVFSLIDGSLLYDFAANDDFATRAWHGFDSSPIYVTEADTLIYPGENGVLYTVHLNTRFDEADGRLSVAPDETVKYAYASYAADERYEASENGNGSGSESSAVIWENYLFFGDNGGIFQCLDLNTMEPVWVQDLLEDINSSPVLEFGDGGEMYLYVGTTLKYHFDRHHLGEACVYKLDARTGEIVWKKPYEVHTVLGLAGGVLASGAGGRGRETEDYIFYAISKCPSVDSSYIVALSKTTGEEYWRVGLPCDAWSSGCLTYTADGAARLIQCCGNGDILLMDALTGTVLDSVNYGANIEATPVIYGDRLVVGIRSEAIVGARIK